MLQVLNLSDWNTAENYNEIQEICLKSCTQLPPCENETQTFLLSYDGDVSVPISRKINASMLQHTLNSISKLRSRGHVNVTSAVTENCTLLRVEFLFTDANDVKLLVDSTTYSPTPVQTIRRVVTGGSTKQGISLTYGGISSVYIKSGSTAAQVKDVLTDLFSWKCEHLPETSKRMSFNILTNLSRNVVLSTGEAKFFYEFAVIDSLETVLITGFCSFKQIKIFDSPETAHYSVDGQPPVEAAFILLNS